MTSECRGSSAAPIGNTTSHSVGGGGCLLDVVRHALQRTSFAAQGVALAATGTRVSLDSALVCA